MRKLIVVFANSVKHGKHCVAGKEVQTKKWIRPVSNVDGAELDDHQCKYGNPYGKFKVKPLQKIEIDVAQHSPLIHQPENYLIGNGEWSQKYKIEPFEVMEYLDFPDALWGTENRIIFSSIESREIQIAQSLYLVKVDDLRIYRNIEYKRRASFVYNGNSYDLPVTDPNFDAHIDYPQHQNVLCVSLGEKYDPNEGENYSCYKIVAAII